MASEKQVEANRENAKKSTGPKTEEGKEAVAQNAVTHGLCAQAVLLWNENPAEWDAMREDLLADNRTGTAVEKALLGRVALYTWRLRRAAHVEREMLEGDMRAPVPREREFNDQGRRPCSDQDTRYFGGRIDRKMREDGGWSRFARYESMLQRGLYGAMRELRLFRRLALQEARADNDCRGPDTDKIFESHAREAKRHAALMAAESQAAEERLARSIDRGQVVPPTLATAVSPYENSGNEELQNKANSGPARTMKTASRAKKVKRAKRVKPARARR